MCEDILITTCIIGNWNFIFQILVASLLAGLLSGYVVGLTYLSLNRNKKI